VAWRPRWSLAGRKAGARGERASGYTAGLLAPRPAEHADEEGRTGVGEADDAPARVKCGGAGVGQRRRLLKSERRTGGAGTRVRWGFCCGLGWPEGRLRIRGEGKAGRLGVRASRATDPELPAVSLRPDLIRAQVRF
jgi:hypothetical protein